MNKRLIAILIANLFAAAPAYAQSDDFKIEGSVSVGGMAVDSNDAKDTAKRSEYMDISDGFLGGFDLKGRSKKYWLDAFGENLGRDDQYINLRGGGYDMFKYRLYTDSLKHNFLDGAGLTPYGSNNTATFPSLDTTKWNSVELGYKRRDGGGYFEYSGGTPWYFRLDANQVQTKGSKPGASSQGTSPGNGFVDLQFPVDYETKNWTVEGGYATKTMILSIAWMTSKFTDNSESFDWTNGYFGNGRDTTYLAPDNKYSRFAANATFRQLPGASTFALRYTQDELESNATNGTRVLGTTTGGYLNTGPNVGTFNGKVENETFSASLDSTPMKNFDTRIYYNYRKRDNKSTDVIYNAQGSTGAGGPFEGEGFAYKKTHWGVDGFYRVNRENRLGVGFDYLETDRERYDFDHSTDRRWWAEWKNSTLENLSARLKYTSLSRSSDFLLGNSGTGPSDPDYINRFTTAFDVSNVDQSQVKLTLAYTPMEFLDLGFEGIWKKNEFKDNLLGRTKDQRDEYFVNASYGNPQGPRFTVFADWEKAKYDSTHRVGFFPPFDPTFPPTTSTPYVYNWYNKTKDDNWAFGASIDWPAMEKLMVKASYVYYKTDGSVDLQVQDGTPASVVRPVPIGNWDDSTRQSFNLKGIYSFSKAISFTAGWAYEKYEYADAQYDGYRYTIPATNRQDSYLNGIYAYPQHKTNIFYGWLTYKF